jgi:hypothetical protein
VEQDLAKRLHAHVTAVASRPHNIDHYADLERAAVYIETAFRELGYKPQPQVYECRGKPVRNIEVAFEPAATGSDPSHRTSKPTATVQREGSDPIPTYVLGAHYDSPDDSPGANDNGTGVAAILEIARLLSGWTPSRHRLRLVLWVNEEAPYGHTPEMGSWQHAKSLMDRGERVVGAISLETIGYFSDEPGSQQFPAPFGLVYPDTGNFIAFVGLTGARRLVRKTLGSFRRHTAFPSIGGVAPGFLDGISLSDHWAYHQFGIPALMITDTAPFRNPHYHEIDDLPDTVDYESLARVTKGVERMVREVVK